MRAPSSSDSVDELLVGWQRPAGYSWLFFYELRQKEKVTWKYGSVTDVFGKRVFVVLQ